MATGSRSVQSKLHDAHDDAVDALSIRIQLLLDSTTPLTESSGEAERILSHGLATLDEKLKPLSMEVEDITHSTVAKGTIGFELEGKACLPSQ